MTDRTLTIPPGRFEYVAIEPDLEFNRVQEVFRDMLIRSMGIPPHLVQEAGAIQMTDRTAFREALDADPGNQELRSVYADYLDEHGETEDDRVLVLAMRWEVELRFNPTFDASSGSWMWCEETFWRRGEPDHIPHVGLRGNIARWTNSFGQTHKNYFTREAAELALGRSLLAMKGLQNG